MHIAKKYDDLDKIAMKWVNGEIEQLEIRSLPIYDRLYVLGMFNLYFSHRLGYLSTEQGEALKLQFMTEIRELKLKLYWAIETGAMRSEKYRKAATLLDEIAFMYREKEVDLVELCKKQAEALDAAYETDVYLKMCCKAINEEDPFISTTKVLVNEGGDIPDKYEGEIPFITIMRSFFSYVLNFGKEMWMQLTGEDYPTKAKENWGCKDNDFKQVKKGLEKHYGKLRD